MKTLKLSSLLLATAVLAFGCSDDEASDIEVEGVWDTEFSTTESIDSLKWGEADIVVFDNEANYAITQNASDAEFSPDKFNKLVWIDVSGDIFFYCTVDFGKDTLEDAENTTNVADASDPATTGCGTFPWSKLTLKAQ